MYLRSGSPSVLLVDADPDQVAELTAACDAPRVSVAQAALSGDLTPRSFFRLSQPEMNSLRAPAELTALFPGLRVLSQDTVTPQDPAAFLTPWLPDEASAVLVLETPGEVLGILQSLAEAGILQRFSTIILSEATEPLYAGAAPLARIRDYLDASGFVVTCAVDPERPEHPWLFARLSTAAAELRRLQDRLEAQNAAFKDAQARIETLTQEREAADRSIADLRKKLTSAIEQSEKDADARQDALQKMESMHAEILKAEGQIKILSELFRGRQDA